MKNTSIILFIITTLILANSASAQTIEDSKYEITCLENAGITIKSQEYIDDNSAHQKTTVSAKRLSDNTTFDVPGIWSDRYFTSEELLFNESGAYNITINMHSEHETEQSVNCPGLIFSCKVFSLSISSCYRYEDALHISFETVNAFENLDLKNNLTYSMTNDRAHTIEVSQKKNNQLLDVIETFNIGEEKYKIIWPVSEKIETFYIRAPVCRAYASAKCIEPPGCKNDDECQDSQYCDTYCRELNCKNDEQVHNHRCVSCILDRECDDSLICTQDTCTNNRCIHNSVVCEAQDACTTARCEEPQGCVYVVDEDCKKSKENTANPGTEEPQDPDSKSNMSYIGAALLLLILALILKPKNKPETKQEKKSSTKAKKNKTPRKKK
ncbi:MAG: hypothetical protein KAH93_05580 [Candidatus Aenigmarchaeota archaeon]|nr:hypothetical protein [Candidatus Aenigmarchaeota archaeon]